jgi:hypothetical protein
VFGTGRTTWLADEWVTVLLGLELFLFRQRLTTDLDRVLTSQTH